MSSSVYMAEPPAGQVRHYYNPPTAHKELTATGVSTTIIAAAIVAVRVFTRAIVTKNGVHMDDYMILGALGLSFVMLGLSFAHMKAGLGFHFWDVKQEGYVFAFQVYTLAVTISYATSLAFTKISILLFYLRLSPARWFHILVWTLIAIVITYAVVYDLMSIFGCKPIAASWDLRLIPTAKCVDTFTKYMALSVLNIIIDVFTLILPIPVVIPLQMSVRQKISNCAVFATGGFVCAIAVRRTTLLSPLMTSSDYTWALVEQYHWCYAEVNAAIVCASAPAMNPFFARYIPGLLSSKFGSDECSNNNKKQMPTLETISQKKSRKLVVKDAYELHSRDDVSEEMKAGKEMDDETRLWRGSRKDLGFSSAKVVGQPVVGQPVVRQVDVEEGVDGRLARRASDARVDAPGRIHGTSETKISFGRS